MKSIKELLDEAYLESLDENGEPINDIITGNIASVLEKLNS